MHIHRKMYIMTIIDSIQVITAQSERRKCAITNDLILPNRQYVLVEMMTVKDLIPSDFQKHAHCSNSPATALLIKAQIYVRESVSPLWHPFLCQRKWVTWNLC